MAQKCERCGAMAGGYEMHDYCAECMKDLCPACMEKGCRGHVPAKSGEEQDYPEELGSPELNGEDNG